MEARARTPVGPPFGKPLPSYWQEPKSPLAKVSEVGINSTDKTYDYAIIGSGVSGTMIAYNLLKSKPGCRVVMFEAREICSGATGRNGGHTKAASYRTYPQHVAELGKEEALKIARLEHANIIATHSLVIELEIDCESQVCETLDAIYDTDTFKQGKSAIEALRRDATEEEREQRQMAWYQIHDKAAALQNDFHLCSSNENAAIDTQEELVGVFEYLAGRIHSYQFTTGVLHECVGQGLQLCANTPVHTIVPSDGPAEAGRWKVCYQHNTIKAHNVILATNGYTASLLETMQGKIVPMRGQITAQRPGLNNKLNTPLTTTYSFIYRDGYEYMIPRELSDGSQHLVIGGGLGRLPHAGASEYGSVDDGSLNSDISKYLKGSLLGYFGRENWGQDSSDDRVAQEWTGIMGATADGRPFVGEVPRKSGLWISAGFNGHGMVLCLKSAEALVEMIVENKVKECFPKSFLITEDRLAKTLFQGVRDVSVV